MSRVTVRRGQDPSLSALSFVTPDRACPLSISVCRAGFGKIGTGPAGVDERSPISCSARLHQPAVRAPHHLARRIVVISLRRTRIGDKCDRTSPRQRTPRLWTRPR